MSGINEIKKKAKLSIEEMYDNQAVGKLDNQKENNPDNQETNHPDGKQINHTTNKQDVGVVVKSAAIFATAKQQTKKIPVYKMTFNLTEDVYKAFNDLYANRMLQGRKTEKSEMICEAIQWLVKMEEEQK